MKILRPLVPRAIACEHNLFGIALTLALSSPVYCGSFPEQRLVIEPTWYFRRNTFPNNTGMKDHTELNLDLDDDRIVSHDAIFYVHDATSKFFLFHREIT